MSTRPGRAVAVYLCHCGQNIAATVDVEAVARALEGRAGVALVRHYPYLCSRPGQDLIRQDLEAGRADRVVVAACSPRMHEATFQRAVSDAGRNPYLLRHVNVREQCAWVHPDRREATAKALDLVIMGIERVLRQAPLQGAEAPVEPRALVLGAGPAGLAAAGTLAGAGIAVVLVERSGRLGGRALDLGRAFPGGGEVGPWLRERVAAVEADPRVEVLTGATLASLEGSPGRFRAGIRAGTREVARKVGTVIAATGYDLYRPDDPAQGRPELAYGEDPRVITQAELEQRLRAGPALPPQAAVVFLQCVGSRDRTAGASHCSRVCCMVSVRQARELRSRSPGVEVHVLYMDLRAYARGAEEDYEAAAREGVLFRRGSASEVYRRGGRLAVRFEDTLLGEARELAADLVVLACGARPRTDAADVARILGLARSPDGFFLEAHPKLRPVDTASTGLFLAGACLGPRTLDEAVASGRAAAARALGMLLPGRMAVSPVVAEIDPDRCSGCGLCEAACPAGAIRPAAHLAVRTVDPGMCRGCGACGAVCPSKAVVLRHFSPGQVLGEVHAACAGP